jgi:hypothetical protein
MKRTILTSAAICTALLVLSPAALAEYTWNGSTSEDWSNPSNWDKTNGDTGYPDSRSAIVTIVEVYGGYDPGLDCDPNVGQLSIISAGWLQTNTHTLTVDTSGEPTGRLVIDSTSILDIEPWGTVDLDDGTDHQIAGEIWIWPRAELHFGSNASVSPYNSTYGEIEGWDNEYALITVASGKTLTNHIQITGAMQIQASGATFVNDGIVEANHSDTDNDKLTCYSGTFAGNGDAHGTYKVSDPNSTLWFFTGITDATDLESNFEVTAGTLDIDTDVWTSGDLTFTGGTIDVAAGASFAVNQ